MRTLRHKLRRDLWRLRYQVLTIALLVGCGIASFVAAMAAHASVAASRDAFYADARLADVFVHLESAPRPILDRLRDLPGVASVEGRVVGDFRLELDGGTEPVAARFVSLSWPAELRLDRPELRMGRDVEPGRADEVVIDEHFAEAWRLIPGSSLIAVIAGRRVVFHVVGVAISPEFVWAPAPRTGLADPRHFGVVWMDGEALAKSTGLVGAFDDAMIQLAVGADPQETIERVDHLLEPYGGLGAVARDDQPSVKLIDQKLGQLARLARSLPALFLAIATFLLNVLLSRIVGTQREQIATLKALGYRTRELTTHYLGFAIVICALGALFGIGLGVLGAHALLTMYARYFRFSSYLFRFDGWAIVGATGFAILAGLAGTFFAVRRAVSVPPAEAMRPEAPPSYKRSRLEPVYAVLPPAVRMVIRDVLRRPMRLLLSAGSIALATAIVLAGSVLDDSMQDVLRLQFEVSHREDITATFDHARELQAIDDIAHLPGVVAAEGERVVPVRLRAGSRTRTTAILGLAPAMELHRLLDADKRTMQLAPAGLALSRPLAESLGIRPGDELEVEVLELGRRKLRVPVATLVDDLLGISGYMDAAALARLLDETPRANLVLISVDPRDVDAVTLRLNTLPAVASVSRPALDRALVQAEISDEMVVLQLLLSVFAAAIAVGVVYNNARIALELRSRDLATLRILGFTRAELAVVLLGEQAIQIVLGIAAGAYLGRRIGGLVISTLDRELIRVPISLSARSYVAGLSVVVLAALASALLVRRRSDRLDLVAVLKARD